MGYQRSRWARLIRRSNSRFPNSSKSVGKVGRLGLGTTFKIKIQDQSNLKTRSTAADRSVRSTCSARQAQRAFHRLDNLRIYLHARIETAQFIVENFADLGGMTKDTADHGHRDGSVFLFWKKAIHHNG